MYPQLGIYSILCILVIYPTITISRVLATYIYPNNRGMLSEIPTLVKKAHDWQVFYLVPQIYFCVLGRVFFPWYAPFSDKPILGDEMKSQHFESEDFPIAWQL